MSSGGKCNSFSGQFYSLWWAKRANTCTGTLYSIDIQISVHHLTSHNWYPFRPQHPDTLPSFRQTLSAPLLFCFQSTGELNFICRLYSKGTFKWLHFALFVTGGGSAFLSYLKVLLLVPEFDCLTARQICHKSDFECYNQTVCKCEC